MVYFISSRYTDILSEFLTYRGVLSWSIHLDLMEFYLLKSSLSYMSLISTQNIILTTKPSHNKLKNLWPHIQFTKSLTKKQENWFWVLHWANRVLQWATQVLQLDKWVLQSATGSSNEPMSPLLENLSYFCKKVRCALYNVTFYLLVMRSNFAEFCRQFLTLFKNQVSFAFLASNDDFCRY